MKERPGSSSGRSEESLKAVRRLSAPRWLQLCDKLLQPCAPCMYLPQLTQRFDLEIVFKLSLAGKSEVLQQCTPDIVNTCKCTCSCPLGFSPTLSAHSTCTCSTGVARRGCNSWTYIAHTSPSVMCAAPAPHALLPGLPSIACLEACINLLDLDLGNNSITKWVLTTVVLG